MIFDFEKAGTDPPEREEGISYHRIGIDIIRSLLEASESLLLPTSSREEWLVTTSVPRLTSAPFIVPSRERKVSDVSHGDRDSRIETREEKSPAVVEGGKTSVTPVQPEQPETASWLSSGPHAPNEEPRAASELLSEAAPYHQGDGSDEAEADGTENIPGARGPKYDVLLGVEEPTPQYGIFGEIAGRRIALDLNETHTISLFGVQGGGKSYTLGNIIEMACIPIPNLNLLPHPLATVVFHYSQTQDYRPEFISMLHDNSEARQIAILRERYGVEPAHLGDVVVLVPPRRMDVRRAEYPGVEVLPISFAAAELKAMHWKFLMGAVGSQSMYLRQVNMIMRTLGDSLTLEKLIDGVEHSNLGEHLKDLARIRLQFAAEYVDDRHRLTNIVRPGRLVIVDLRDDNIEKDEALGLFVVLLQLFSEATYEGSPFNKLVVFDEAHKYIENSDLVAGLIEVVREMRHKGTSILVASQDPKSVPVSIIELSTQMILHRFNSPDWLKHIQRANAALHSLTAEKMSQLGAGEAYVWSSKATDDAFTSAALRVRCRPRVTQHGGSTRTAVTNLG